MTGNGSQPLVFVTVGTDHHRFDRLVGAVGAWGAANPDARVVVQHGTADPVAGVANVASDPFLAPERFRALLDEAAAVVCPGGPGGIMETRAAGLRPIVVPRRAHLDEHVDDHQLAFSRFLAEHDLVTLAEETPELCRALDRVVQDPTTYAIPASDAAPAGITGIGARIDTLVWGDR
jgi:UDP-N-acetylglucosamine transferase subunit ALG13